jgi:membrane fusion protein, multidrug efflux system
MTVQGSKEPFDGTVLAIDPTVDASSRNVRVRASAEDPRGRLRPGMFVEVTVVLPQRAPIVTVPATAIVHASYGDSVFVVDPKLPGSPGMATTPDGKTVKVARQQFVRVGTARGDFVSIAEGLAPGQTVVSAGAFKLNNGAPVVVDNRVKPAARLDPHPENR